jgi:hypothetical protein
MYANLTTYTNLRAPPFDTAGGDVLAQLKTVSGRSRPLILAGLRQFWAQVG